jgi:hypothetical protein
MKMKKICFFVCVAAVWLLTGCSGIYDNITDMVAKETVYPGKLDGIIRTQIGYERVEIDLMEAGRIPSSQMHLGKAVKTVIEYDQQVITIDSVCSWVNITGLTELKSYTFKIYTVDEYGNKSVSFETSAIPYTKTDLDKIVLTEPKTFPISMTDVQVSWTSEISSVVADYYGMAYSYTDKNNTQHVGIRGKDENPDFTVNNISLSAGSSPSVLIIYRIVPKILNEPILDTLLLERTFSLSEKMDPLIMISGTNNGVELDEARHFEWSAVGAEINSYTLRFSTSEAFSPSATVDIPVGNATSFDMTPEWYEKVAKLGYRSDIYWTVTPGDGTPGVGKQVRWISGKWSIAGFSSSFDMFGFHHTNLIDGQTTTSYISSDAVPNAWISIDFHKRLKVEGFVFVHFNSQWSNPTKIKVEVSEDNSTWTPLFPEINLTWQPDIWQRFPATTPKYGRYLKITGLESGVNDGGVPNICVAEAGIYYLDE